MRVWALFVNGKLDSLHVNIQSASRRVVHLKNVNGDQLASHMQELEVLNIEYATQEEE